MRLDLGDVGLLRLCGNREGDNRDRRKGAR